MRRRKLPKRPKLEAIEITITVPALIALPTTTDLTVIVKALLDEWVEHSNLVINDESIEVNWDTLVFLDTLANRLNKIVLGE